MRSDCRTYGSVHSAVILVVLLRSAQASTADNMQKSLLLRLFNDYHKELRPTKHEGLATNVSVQLYFKQIQKVKENDQIITVYCWLEEYWVDEFLQWNPDDFGGIRALHVPADMIWKPDLLVYNNANMNVQDNELQTNVAIEWNGRISLFRALITDITCDLDMQRFPFDQQICFIMLASWSFDGSQIMLQMVEEARDSANISNLGALTHYIPNMEWQLVDFKCTPNLKYYECCPHPYPDISYYFSIKRNPSYYLFTLIVPSAFITIVTVVGFFTPQSSTGENTEKVSLGVTALLSLAIILMMVSDKLPATSNSVPLLGQYYIGLIMIMFAATYCTTWTLSVQMHGNAGRPIPRRIRIWLLGCKAHGHCVLSWIFSRELENTQESIRLRLNKYDKLTELKRNFARQFIDLQHRLIRSDGFAKHDERNGVPESGWGRPTVHGSHSHGTALPAILSDLLKCVQSIREELLSYEHLRRIRNEWQMLARMLEKLLMLLFTTFTIVFAVFMLYDTQPPPIITEAFMKDKSKA